VSVKVGPVKVGADTSEAVTDTKEAVVFATSLTSSIRFQRLAGYHPNTYKAPRRVLLLLDSVEK
jgi:hypothetical protein